MDVAVWVVLALLPAWLLWRLGRSTAPALENPADFTVVEPASAEPLVEDLYREGDGEAVLERLPRLSLDEFVPKATALGRYTEAWSAVEPLLRSLDPTDFREGLLLVNAAEPLSELGRLEESLALLDRPSPYPLVESGRRCALAWNLASLDRPADALESLRDTDVEALLDYQCEYWMTLAFALRRGGALAECEAALKRADGLAVRASSRRNLDFQWAELHLAQGDVDRALARYEAGASHRWRWQGGPSLLAWGTLLAELGRHEAARTAWRQCVAQDPQSPAASDARGRLLDRT